MKKLLGLLPVAAALAAAGCGATAGAAPSRAQVAVRHTKLGNVLVTRDGRTLYLFEQDKGTASTCYGACASLWPPLLTGGGLVAGRGAQAAELGTTRRRDGRREVTYAGHPLYLYAGDHRPGDVTGQDLNQFGAKWYVLAPSGRKIDDD